MYRPGSLHLYHLSEPIPGMIFRVQKKCKERQVNSSDPCTQTGRSSNEIVGIHYIPKRLKIG